MTAPSRTERQSRWPLTPATVRAVLSGHGILGLAFAAIIYIVCLSGTFSVFAPDFQRWERPATPAVTTIRPGMLDKAIATAGHVAPAGTSLYIALPKPTTTGATITAFSETYDREWALADDGTLVAMDTPFSDFVVRLHTALLLPETWGRFLVGLAGVALLSSLVSGILAHPRIFKDAFHLRLGGSRRLQEADWHNRLGIWPLPFHVAIALTGALLGLSTVIVGALAMLLYRGDTAQVYALFLDKPAAVNAAALPLPSIDPLIAEARRRAPGAEPSQIIVTNMGRADARISIASERDRRISPQDTTMFDAHGHVVKDEHPGDLAAGTKILGGIGQLHFGWFGGAPVRLLYGLLGLALCVVTSSGVTIWLARRRDKGRAVPGWERIWACVAWGQPLLLASAAGASALFGAGSSMLTTLWVAGTATLLVLGAMLKTMDAMPLAKALRIALAILTVTASLANLAARSPGPVGMVIDLAGIGVAVLLTRGLWRRSRKA